MRTLKKVLALSLALSMLFSLTAFAGFTDEDKIDGSLKSDIELIGALNVMEGDKEGTFRPTDTISRAEAAKMVYVVRNGGKTTAEGWTGMTTFSDVPSGAWYEGYVNYCASLGIIAGVGNGKFNPSGSVTGTELAKMLLVVAGYKPDVQGYTGSGWNNNVINDAQLAGLFDGYEVAYSASAPRQWAAKMFSNAILKAEMAVYFNGELVNGVGFVGTATTTIGEKYFSLQTQVGVLDSNYYASLEGKLGDRKVSEIKWTEDKKAYSATFGFNASTELLGQEVKVIYKETNPGTNAGLDSKDTVFNVYSNNATNVVKTTRDAGDIDGTTLKISGVNGGKKTDYKDKTIEVYTDGAFTRQEIKVTSDGDLKKIFNDSYENVTLILDDDDMITHIFIDNVSYAFINKNDAAKGQFSLKDAEGKSISLKDEDNNTLTFGNTTDGKEKLADYINLVDNVSEGDFVMYTASVDTGKLVYTVALMESAASGTMTVRNGLTKATIGGTVYNISSQAVKGFSEMPALNVDETFYVYTDGKYAVYVTNESGATSSKISSKIAYVINAAAVKDDWGQPLNRIQVLMADGTNKVFEYADKKDSYKDHYIDFDATPGTGMKGKVFEYVLTGDKIYFRDWSYTPAANKVEYNKTITDKYKESTQRFGAYPTDGNSYFFFVDTENDKYSVVKASELKDDAVMLNGTATTVYKNNIPTIAFGVVEGLGSTLGTSQYAFIRSIPYSGIADGKIVDMVDITLSNGEKVDGAVVNAGTPVKGKIMKVTPVDDQYKFEASDGKLAEGTVSGSNSSILMVNVTKKGEHVTTTGANQAFTVTSDSQYFFYDSSKDKLVDEIDIEQGMNVLFSVDKDGNLMAAYIDVTTKPVAPPESLGKDVTINGLTAFIKGATLPTATTNTSDVTLQSATWSPDGTAKGDTEYTLVLTFKAASGYKFHPDMTKTNIKGLPTGYTVSTFSGPNTDTLTVTLTYTTPAVKIATDPIAITLADLTYGEGSESFGNATIGSITGIKSAVTTAWKTKAGADVGANVVDNTNYVVTITLEAEAEYVFDGSYTATLTGTGYTEPAPTAQVTENGTKLVITAGIDVGTVAP